MPEKSSEKTLETYLLIVQPSAPKGRMNSKIFDRLCDMGRHNILDRIAATGYNQQERDDFVPVVYDEDGVRENAETAILRGEFPRTPADMFDGQFYLSNRQPDRKLGDIIEGMQLPPNFFLFRARVIDAAKIVGVLKEFKNKYKNYKIQTYAVEL